MNYNKNHIYKNIFYIQNKNITQEISENSSYNIIKKDPKIDTNL